MLEQLIHNFEPILAAYGIWVALFFAVMVMLPVGIVIWLQKRQQQPVNNNNLEQTLQSLQQQVAGLETVLNQYQQQIAGFSESTRTEWADLIEQHQQAQTRVLRLKAELSDTEAQLPQLGDQLLSQLEDFEAEVIGLKERFEGVENAFKRLPQLIADTRTQLHQLQSEFEALPTTLANWSALRLRLQGLQSQLSPKDPLAYQKNVNHLQQDIQAATLTAQQQAVTAVPTATASEPSALSPRLEATAASSAPQPQPLVQPEAKPAVSPEAPGPLTLDELLSDPAEQVGLKAPAEASSAEESSAPLAPADPEPAAPVFEGLSQDIVNETFLAQRGSVEESESEALSEAETAVPLETLEQSSSDADDPPEQALSEELVTETFLAQRGSIETETAARLESEAEQATAAQAERELLEAESVAQAKLRLKSRFEQSQQQLQSLDLALARITEQYQELESGFVAEAWSEALPALERSRYLAAEAHEMYQLAQKLVTLPQTPLQRVQLNLLRIEQKAEQLQVTHEQLQSKSLELENEIESLNTRLMQAAGQLQSQRDHYEPHWLQQQAGRLKDVRQGLERRPLNLPACRQQLRQIELEIASESQAEL